MTKIFAITVMNDDSINSSYSLYGIEGVLLKPINVSVLRPIIEQISFD